MILTRQGVPVIEGTSAEGVARGGYVLGGAPDENPDVVIIATGSELQRAVAPDGSVADLALFDADPALVSLFVNGRPAYLGWRADPPSVRFTPAITEGWLAVPICTAAGIEVHLISSGDLQTRAGVLLAGASRLALRLTPQDLTLADDRGRYLVLDLSQGRVLRSGRVS